MKKIIILVLSLYLPFILTAQEYEFFEFKLEDSITVYKLEGSNTRLINSIETELFENEFELTDLLKSIFPSHIRLDGSDSEFTLYPDSPFNQDEIVMINLGDSLQFTDTSYTHTAFYGQMNDETIDFYCYTAIFFLAERGTFMTLHYNKNDIDTLKNELIYEADSMEILNFHYSLRESEAYVTIPDSPNIYFTTDCGSSNFYLDENGVTIKCKNCQPGDTGTVNGIHYEAVDSTLLTQKFKEGADLSKLCTSLVTNMSGLFSGKNEFNQDIGSWDVSNVTNMNYMFYQNWAFNQDIGSWDVSNVMDMGTMFYDARIFDQNLGLWDVSNVTDMSSMFSHAFSFNQDISAWDVSNVMDMSNMFMWAETFNQNIGSWDVGNVTDMTSMFSHAFSFNQDIGNWNVHNVNSMWSMFRYASSFNQDIGRWNVSNVNDMGFMFAWSGIFNQDIGSWDVSNVTDMSCMFIEDTLFNQNISAWDVSKVTNMSDMFMEAKSFNHDIGSWDVSNVLDMSDMFYGAESFNYNIGSWNVSNVTDMSNMFDKASSFNQNIGDWDVGNVIYMYGMFHFANAFNQNISSWNVSNVIDMSDMFFNAASFNKDLSGWCVKNIQNEPEGFADNCPLQQEYFPLWGTCPSPINIYEMESSELFSIYPNPTNEKLNIKGPQQETTGSIYDVNGQLIFTFEISAENGEVNVSHLSAGIYILKMKIEESLVVKRFTKE